MADAHGAGGPLLSRRTLLGTAAAITPAGALGVRAGRADAATGLLRIVDLGQGATLHPGSPADLRVGDNRALLAESGTAAVRLWADWPILQPDPAVAPGDPASRGAPFLAALDGQIAAANEDGLRVVLQFYRFPTWANGTAELAAARGTDAEISFAYADRIAPAAWARYVAAGRDPAAYSPSRRALEFAVPAQGCGPGSAWAAMFAFLHERYRPGTAGPFVDAIELVNEPNFQLWPQRAPSPTADPFALGPVVVQRTVAEMMASARAVSAAAGHPGLLLTPSFADSNQGGRTVTHYDELAVALLDELAATGAVVGANEAWTHHDYTDVEGRVEATKTQHLRTLLAGRWTGLADSTGPVVLITEGGARLSQMRALYPTEDPRAAQAESIRLALERHARADGPGAGVWMFAQYTLHADPSFDCGLLEAAPSTTRRPSFAAWSAGPRGGAWPTPGRW
jgi:hypothetical protein